MGLGLETVTLPSKMYALHSRSIVCTFFIELLFCSDQKLLAYGPGETLSVAEEEAARVALRKLFGYTENRRPFDFTTINESEEASATVQAASRG